MSGVRNSWLMLARNSSFTAWLFERNVGGTQLVTALAQIGLDLLDITRQVGEDCNAACQFAVTQRGVVETRGRQ